MSSTPRALKVQLLVFQGCPLADAARASLKEALAALGIGAYEEIDLRDAATPTELRGWGSPTILVDGEDIAAGVKGDGVCCRVHPGRNQVPTPRQIAAAIERRR